MKKISIGLIALLQSGCGLGDSVDYLGAVRVEPNAAGAVQGVPQEDLSVYTDASGNGYVHGFTIGVDPDDFSDGNIAGAGANYAVSGILPDATVGARPINGTASMFGRYDLTHVAGYADTSNPRAWTVTQAGGPLTFDVNFQTGEIKGDSLDGTLRIRRQGEEDDGSGLVSFENGAQITVRYDGTNGDVRDFAIGEDGAVGAFNGQGNNDFFAGGFAVSAD